MDENFMGNSIEMEYFWMEIMIQSNYSAKSPISSWKNDPMKT